MWAKKEVMWSMVGSQTTKPGDCSKFKGNVPHCCKKDHTFVDFLLEHLIISKSQIAANVECSVHGHRILPMHGVISNKC
jgi:hypothetical protein